MFYRVISALGILSISCLFLSLCHPAHAEERFREKIKERIASRISQKTANQDADVYSKITQSGDYNFSIQHDGLTRSYIVHVPPNYNPQKPTPLVFAFHGGGGDMDYMASERYGLKSKADKSGFIIVFPNGYSKFNSGLLATWNAGECCGDARDKKIDDIGFIETIVQNVSQQMNIDRNRIFATGMSNGGMISYAVACELPHIFRAIAAVAGTDNTTTCSHSRPISILHIHAKDDTHVLFNGGAGKDAFKDPSKVTDFNSVPDTLSKWVQINKCQGSPERVKTVKGAYCDLYNKCAEDIQVKICVTETGGHSWPGGEKRRAKNPPSKAISANDEIWDFFENQK